MKRHSREVLIDGRRIGVAVRESARARRARLRVGPRRPLELVVPAGTSEAEIDRVIEGRSEWIARKSEWARKLAARPARLGLDRPGVVWVGGSPIPILTEAGGRPVARLTEHGLLVRGQPDGAAAAIGRWYRREARRRLETATRREGDRLGLVPGPISIRDQRTRWGSCSTSGAISYSWRLLLAPVEVLEYVVCHEVCHLRVPNHSQRFWRLLTRVRPDWPERAGWLREHSLEIGDYQPRLR